eukprot:gene29778-36873_t
MQLVGAKIATSISVDQYCVDLSRISGELHQEAASFCDELRFVANHCGISLSSPVLTGSNATESRTIEDIISRIEGLIKLIQEGKISAPM